MNTLRAMTARAAASALRTAHAKKTLPRAIVGFDGFLDEICQVVDARASARPGDFTPIDTIEEFSERVALAAGRSANLELVVRETRPGGNGPLLAAGLSGLGAKVIYIGCVGSRGDTPASKVVPIHPVFEAFAAKCDRVVAVGPPGRTDALEFTDGKLMLNVPAPLASVTWETVCDRLGGAAKAYEHFADRELLAVVNWSVMPGVDDICRGLMRDVLPRLAAHGLTSGKSRRLFVDLSDPAKRSDADVRGALAIIGAMNANIPVTLGLNLAEAERLAEVYHVKESPSPPDPIRTSAFPELSARVLRLTQALREAVRVSCVVVHPREGAAGADDKGGACWLDGPFTRRPRLSTGAGDHFNAGFAFGRCLELPLEQCLAMAVATSGAYVRDGASPDHVRVASFLDALPEPEGAPISIPKAAPKRA